MKKGKILPGSGDSLSSSTQRGNFKAISEAMSRTTASEDFCDLLKMGKEKRKKI